MNWYSLGGGHVGFQPENVLITYAEAQLLINKG